MEETEEQAIASWPIRDIADITHVEGGGLRGKLLNLGVGNTAQKGLRGDNRFQPGEALRPLPEVFERGPARRVFDPCELAPPGVDGDEGIQAGLLGRAQGGRHLCIERLMDLVTHMTDQAVPRPKRSQLKTVLNEMLDPDTDHVGGAAPSS